MLMVKTNILPSPIAGIGLFAAEFIPKGTRVWEFRVGFDIRVTKNYPDQLQEPAKSFFAKYAFQYPQTLDFILCADDARFFNHADTPNVQCLIDADGAYIADVAARDIQSGEELTIDYREFDSEPFHGFDTPPPHFTK